MPAIALILSPSAADFPDASFSNSPAIATNFCASALLDRGASTLAIASFSAEILSDASAPLRAN
jgi:hypothetical protein